MAILTVLLIEEAKKTYFYFWSADLFWVISPVSQLGPALHCNKMARQSSHENEWFKGFVFAFLWFIVQLAPFLLLTYIPRSKDTDLLLICTWFLTFYSLKFQGWWTEFFSMFLLPVWPAKINFEIDFWRLKIEFAELDTYNLIFQKSSTDQQGHWFSWILFK